MNQEEYIRAIDEMTIPLSKVLLWANTVKEEYHDQYYKNNPELFDRLLLAAHELMDLIPKIKFTEQVEKSQVFTHILGGPIMIIRDNTKLILSQHKQPERNLSEMEQEYVRYLKKISSAAEYLSSLDRDAVLKIMLDELDEGRRGSNQN